MTASSWTYVGLLDDVAERYPWKFNLSKQFLEHLFVVELLHGKPLLLNDGYLVQNTYLRESILRREGLFWELLQAGFVSVMHRGHSLAEMPEKMAKNVDSMRALVSDHVTGIEWKTFRPHLEQLDTDLRVRGQYVKWPRFHSGAGFEFLADRLLGRGASSRSLGIGQTVSNTALSDFLKAYLEALRHNNHEAPRTLWENLAIQFSQNPKYTSNGRTFIVAMMNLANEMYHYNMGLMLSAEGERRISVQTQTSPAFDDLLFPPGLEVLAQDITNAPRLYVPRSIISASPRVLVKILERGSPSNLARSNWLALRTLWEESAPENRVKVEYELRLAAQAYTSALVDLLGEHVQYREPEKIIDYALGEAGLSAIGSAIGSAFGAYNEGAIGLAVGYGISRFKDQIAGSVIRKFRVDVFRSEMKIPQELADYSRKVVEIIKRRKIPSTVELPPEIAASFSMNLKKFDSAT